MPRLKMPRLVTETRIAVASELGSPNHSLNGLRKIRMWQQFTLCHALLKQGHFTPKRANRPRMILSCCICDTFLVTKVACVT